MNYRRSRNDLNLSKHFGQTRTVHDGEGRPYDIYARRVVWDILDFLVAGWKYPTHELIDDLAWAYGPDQVQSMFERNVLYAITAQNWVRYGGANENLFTFPLNDVVPATHAVWHAHLPRQVGQVRLPRVIINGRVRV